MVKRQGIIKKRQSRLEERKDKLQDLNRLIPWERFCTQLKVLEPQKRKSPAGRKPIAPIVLLKMLVLKFLYNLSNEEVEYQAHDRASFRRFLGLEGEAEIPDATTVDNFEKKLQAAGLIEVVFEEFERFLGESGYEAKGGQIIDATLVPVPIQQNRKEENEKIKKGEIPEEWQNKPQKLAQKDATARWTQKNGKSYFGYKNHISIDKEHGFIRRYSVTDASVHDSQQLGAVLDPDNEGREVWADSAYRSENIEAGLEALGHISHIHERAYRNRPLTEEAIASNRKKSKTRAKVEHVFGAWVMSMGGKLMRGIGLERVKAHIGLKNWVYNLSRYVFWQKQESCVLGGQCA